MTAVKWVVGKAFSVCVVDNSSNPLAGQECPHCDSMVRDFSCVPTLLFFTAAGSCKPWTTAGQGKFKLNHETPEGEYQLQH